MENNSNTVERILDESVRIDWYRTPVAKTVMKELMRRDDRKALRHCLLHVGLFFTTATASYLAFRMVTPSNWGWSVPLLLFCLFWHGSFVSFLGGVAVHELVHKTPFARQSLNDAFLHLFSFLTWFDPVLYRLSHVKHHQVTVHRDLDGEVILPQKLDWGTLAEGEVAFPDRWNRDVVKLLISGFLPFPNPVAVLERLVVWARYATGNLKGMGAFAGGEWWLQKLLPDNKPELRARHRRWARIVLLGHLLLAAVLIATGNWFWVVLISCNGTYAAWLGALTGLPQHLGMGPDVPDFRLCCRTYTCSPFIGFLYWNMQYHVEHHMYPAVPFYNLPALREAIAHDVPPAPHGLLATWREIVPVLRRQRADPDYHWVPAIPNASL